MRRVALFIFLVFVSAACAQPASAPIAAVDPGQSIIFYNGVVLTMDPAQSTAEAIVLRGDKIEALGTTAAMLARQEAGTVLIDLAGRTLMPGFVDAHTHIFNDARSQGHSLDQAQALALSSGITTLGDLYVDEPFLREIQAFDAAGQLRVRTSLYLVANTNCGEPTGDWYQTYPPTRHPGEMLRIGGVKIFTDGGSCGGVALSFELQPGLGQGDLWLTQDTLNQMVAEAQAGGYQVAIHAIGDRAVAQAQDAVAAALAGSPNIYRHRLEHVSVLRPEQIVRFGQLGLIPVLNGEYPACTPFGPPVPEAYHAWEWPWRELRAANPGLPLAWHSDYPFLSTNPFVHLYGFVTRIDAAGYYTCAASEWLQDDTLPVADALSIMTRESAYALFRETEVGSLEPGKYADLIVTSGNPLTVAAADLKSLSVLVTMVGGRFEFCNARNTELCPGYQPRTPLPLPDWRPPVLVRWIVLFVVVALPLTAGFSLRHAPLRRHITRLGSLAALAGGALWLWLWFWAMTNTPADARDLLLWPIIACAHLFALASVGLAAGPLPARLGALGLVIAAVGILTMAVGYISDSWLAQGGLWLLILVGLLAHALGLSVFGLSNLPARRRSWLGLLPLVVGLAGVGLPLAMVALGFKSPLPEYFLGAGLGLGWLGLGLLLWRAGRRQPQRATQAA